MHTESSGIISFLWLEKKEKEGEKRKKRSGAGCKQSLNNRSRERLSRILAWMKIAFHPDGHASVIVDSQ